MTKTLFLCLLSVLTLNTISQGQTTKPRVIITSDGEIDDECSMVRCLLYTNDWDVEAIVTTSSQYHWQGHKWAGDHWLDPYLDAYAKVYPNLIKHDPSYPTPEHLRQRTALGNVEKEGEMEKVTDGSRLITKILLNQADTRPIWIQAWGGTNTLARALKTIEEEHPERMLEVATKMRLFLIWEQDATYQSYIRPHWGKYNILTIISDQFEALAYRWKNCQPKELHHYFSASWMKANILEKHGALCSLYKAHGREDKNFHPGDFRSEGDSPAFMHQIVNGLRNMESPDWGGWAGRYIKIRENTWLDPVPVEGYSYPEGRWFGDNGWGRLNSKKGATADTDSLHKKYFESIWRWSEAFQNDFAARADWCIANYKKANHPPLVKLAHANDIRVKAGDIIQLNAQKTHDPDGDKLSYKWWFYKDPSLYKGKIEIKNSSAKKATLKVPQQVKKGETLHIICEVEDHGTPRLTRYQRVILYVHP